MTPSPNPHHEPSQTLQTLPHRALKRGGLIQSQERGGLCCCKLVRVECCCPERRHYLHSRSRVHGSLRAATVLLAPGGCSTRRFQAKVLSAKAWQCLQCNRLSQQGWQGCGRNACLTSVWWPADAPPAVSDQGLPDQLPLPPPPPLRRPTQLAQQQPSSVTPMTPPPGYSTRQHPQWRPSWLLKPQLGGRAMQGGVHGGMAAAQA
ncbi:hypothetical protein HaLaN_00249 [Haematococcus lacustris]|uniref:Uncharacterized protein n=1 Tax=Haematococcus lacustris TaxID=44745 RepID=A0A699YIG5_HAELA|nr:hypothetical protein HaLaN_00249 [Haematococcus lacustris]